MAVIVDQHHPNTYPFQCSTNSSSWVVLGVSGAGYSSIALCEATEPLLNAFAINGDSGNMARAVQFRSVNSNADGSPFWFQYNTNTQPSDTTKASMFESGGGQIYQDYEPFHNIWIQKTVAADTVLVNLKN
jgi:capsid portal protein